MRAFYSTSFTTFLGTAFFIVPGSMAQSPTATPDAPVNSAPNSVGPNASAPTAAGPSSASVTQPAKPVTPAPITIGGYTVSGSVRARSETWSWFETSGFDDSYTFGAALARIGIARSQPKLDQQLELAIPTLFGLPDNAIAPAPRGQLGFGGNYRAGSGSRDASIFPKQLFLRFKGLGAPTNSLRVGRFEFWDGGEVVPKDATLAALKRDRINHRLIGNFGFSHVGRSFDGAQFMIARPSGNLNLMAMRPTEGVFQLNGLGEVKDVSVLYGAYTKPMKKAEARAFAIHYRDDRQAPLSVKVDNRPAAARTADRNAIGVSTLGGHYINTFNAGSGAADLLAWGALQTGDWGNQDHRAGAIALEAGYQPNSPKFKPWLRAGYFRSSGDGNPGDNKHGTFFPILPTPRIYARTPFFNEMNNEDLFVMGILRPTPKLTLRADAHKLRLTQSADLWYAGGGAFQDNSFGYAGRPSGGSRNLATLLDISADYAISPQSSIGLYVGRADGGRVIQSIYADDKLTFAYLELTHKF